MKKIANAQATEPRVRSLVHADRDHRAEHSRHQAAADGRHYSPEHVAVDQACDETEHQANAKCMQDDEADCRKLALPRVVASIQQSRRDNPTRLCGRETMAVSAAGAAAGDDELNQLCSAIAEGWLAVGTGTPAARRQFGQCHSVRPSTGAYDQPGSSVEPQL